LGKSVPSRSRPIKRDADGMSVHIHRMKGDVNMNKLFTRIAIALAGSAMAFGVGAVIGVNQEVTPAHATISTNNGVTTVVDEVYDFNSLQAISDYGWSSNVTEEEKGECIHFSCNGYRRHLQFDNLIPDGCRLISDSVVVSVSGACVENESYTFHVNFELLDAGDHAVARTTCITGPEKNDPPTEYIVNDAHLTPNEKDAVKKLYIYVSNLNPDADPEEICRLRYVKLSYAYEEIYTQTEGIGEGGRFYLINHDSSYGMSNAAVSDANPAGIDLSSANNALLPFDLTLVGHNTYEISTTVDETKYLLINDSDATSGSNDSIRIMAAPSPSVTLTSTNWKITKADDGYTVAQNTTGDTWRYLTFNADAANDFGGYTSVKTMGEVIDDQTSKQDSHIQLVPEGEYAGRIVDAIMSEESGKTLCDGGSTAPSTALWNDIADITKIENEWAVLRETTAAERDGEGLTPSGTDAEKAMARYDYVVGKYGSSTYSDFLGRHPSAPLSAYGGFESIRQSSSEALMIVVIVLAGLASVGGLVLVARKRRRTDK